MWERFDTPRDGKWSLYSLEMDEAESDNMGQVCWGVAPPAHMLSINLWDAFAGGEGITKTGTKHFFVKLAGYQGRT